MVPKPLGWFPAGYRNFDRPMVVVWEKMAKNPQKSRFFQISQKSSRMYLDIKYCFKCTLGHPRDSFSIIYHILNHPWQFVENPNLRRKIDILAKITIFVIFTRLTNRPIDQPDHVKNVTQVWKYILWVILILFCIVVIIVWHSYNNLGYHKYWLFLLIKYCIKI